MSKQVSKWSAEERELLLTFKDECTSAEIAETLGRTLYAVKVMRHKLTNPDLYYATKHRWERTHKRSYLPKNMALVNEWARRKNEQSRLFATNHHDFWTIQDSQYVLDNMGVKIKDIASVLGRTMKSVRNKKQRLLSEGFSLRPIDNPNSGDSV